MQELLQIQSELKAPKSQYNNFGKYAYRNAEDILEAVKPLLAKYKLVMTITDEMVMLGNRYYVKATVRIVNEKGAEFITTAYAREEETKKGMDGSQITGAASSYARKYALNGLFLIDDNKDSDTTNKGDVSSSKPKGGNTNYGQAQKAPSRMNAQQAATVKDLFDNSGAFTPEEQNYWRNEWATHKEWTADEFIKKLQAVVDKELFSEVGE